MTKQVNSRPKSSSKYAESELDKAEKQIDQFEQNIKDLTLDRMNQAPKKEEEQQTKISTRQAQKADAQVLKPRRTLGPGVNPKTGEREKFNEKFRKDWEFDNQPVRFIAENKECIGNTIEIWTKPYAGVDCHYWEVPVNRPVIGPRYLPEAIKKCTYHRLIMDENKPNQMSEGMMQTTGGAAGAVVDETRNRLDALPVTENKSIFMGI